MLCRLGIIFCVIFGLPACTEDLNRLDDAGGMDVQLAEAGRVDAGRGDADAPDTGIRTGPERFLPSTRGGRRLKARLVGPADGVGAFIEWYDSALQHTCTFEWTADGAYRCVPTRYGYTGFVNPTCEGDRLLLHSEPQCGVSRFYSDRTSDWPICDRLGGSTVVYDLTATPTTTPYYWEYIASPGYEDQCFGPRFVREEWAGLSAFGTPHALTDFVAATVTIEGDGEGLGVKVVTAEDGARRVVGSVDPRFGPCFPSRTEPDGDICVPVNWAFTGAYFADAECETDLVAVTHQGTNCAYEETAQHHERESGRNSARLLGAPITSGEIFRRVGRECLRRTVGETIADNPGVFRLHTAGDEVTLQELGFRLLSSRSFQTPFYTGEDGTLLFPVSTLSRRARFVSLETGSACGAYRVGDTWRCIPTVGTVETTISRFSDAECTSPLVMTTIEGPTVLLQTDRRTCPVFSSFGLVDVLAIEGAYVGPTYERGGTDCVRGSDAGPGTFAVGGSIADTFPQLQEWYD